MTERVTIKWTIVNWVTVLLMAAIGTAVIGIFVAGYQSQFGGTDSAE